MKKQAKYKKGQKVYCIITKDPLDVTVQLGEVKAVKFFEAGDDYLYDIDDGTFIIYDREEFEIYGTYKEAVQSVVAYYTSRVELMKEILSKWEKRLNKEEEKYAKECGDKA